MKKISFIGAGNLAFHLAQAFLNANYEIVNIWSNHKKHAIILAELTSAKAVDRVIDAISDSDIIIVSVPDNAIGKVMSDFYSENAILLHTSGSLPMTILQNNAKNFGVIYPLQTFSKEKKVDFSNIPLLIEANSKSTINILEEIASSLSSKGIRLNSEQRMIYHISAVFSCNFANHLFSISKELCDKHDLDFEILKALIAETIEKINTVNPKFAQTGPAIRGDDETIRKHLLSLTDDNHKAIYSLLSESIKQMKHEKL